MSDALRNLILDELVVVLRESRDGLVDEISFECTSGDPPSREEIQRSIQELESTGLIEQVTETHKDGSTSIFLVLSAAGKEYWRAQNPLAERLESASYGQPTERGFAIFAPSDALADKLAHEWSTRTVLPIALIDIDVNDKEVVSATYELEGSGDVIDGVRVEYSRAPRSPSLRTRLARVWESRRRLPFRRD